MAVACPEYSVYLTGMTNLFLTVYAAVTGLFLGSFINVVALRDTNRASIVAGRSKCVHCGHVLAWYDLVPLLSFLFLAGRCRYCRKPLSVRYPLVELTAALMVGIVWYVALERFTGYLPAIGLSVAALLLLAASLIDLQSFEIPLEYVVAAGAIGAGSLLISGDMSLVEVLRGLGVGAGSLLVVLYGWKLLFRQDGMGIGDVWVAGAIGAMLGFPDILVALMAAVFAGALMGMAVIAIQKKDLASQLPFGPFLTFGWLVALLWGQAIVSWYILGL
jgi:leader peptidase (prepilin peptidase)/N-methyltransferase